MRACLLLVGLVLLGTVAGEVVFEERFGGESNGNYCQ